jgi:hypothetical protein
MGFMGDCAVWDVPMRLRGGRVARERVYGGAQEAGHVFVNRSG